MTTKIPADLQRQKRPDLPPVDMLQMALDTVRDWERFYTDDGEAPPVTQQADFRLQLAACAEARRQANALERIARVLETDAARTAAIVHAADAEEARP